MAKPAGVADEDLEAIDNLKEYIDMNAVIIEDYAAGGIDQEDMLYLHLADTPGSTIIFFQFLGSENYQLWSRGIYDGLIVKNKMCTCLRESVRIHLRFRWDRCNAIVKSWLVNYVSKELVVGLMYNLTDQSVWDDWREMFSKIGETQIFRLYREIYQAKQGTMNITTFFTKLKLLWDELAAIDDLSFC